MAYIFYFDYKTKSFLSKKRMETLLVSFSVFFPPSTRATLYHSSWLPPLGPGPDLRGPGGFWRGCPPGPGHDCHLEDGNGIIESPMEKKHFQRRRKDYINGKEALPNGRRGRKK